MVFLQAYFDESGKPLDHDVISFCGFVATPEQWHRCCDAWGAILFNLGLTELKAAKVLRHRSEVSPKLPAQSIEGRIEALTPFVQAIRESVSFGVAVTIDCKAFRALPAVDRKALGSQPQFRAFQEALLMVHHAAEARYSAQLPDLKIALYCDEEEAFAIGCIKLFVNIRRIFPELRKRFVCLGFGDDKYFAQLQAADLIASLARQEAQRAYHGKPFDMKPLYDLFCSGDNPNLAPVEFRLIDGALLAESAKAQRAEREVAISTLPPPPAS